MTVTVTALYIYPLKGAAGLALDSAVAAARGFHHDRRWMVVDEQGCALSQRQHARLATLKVQVTGPGGLLLRGEELPALEVPLPAPEAPRLEVSLWKSHLEAASAADRADRWLRRFLGRPCRLVHLPAEVHRPLDPRFGRPGEEVSFADAYPYLLATEASLADLNQRLPRPVDMRRFRPNIVVSGCGPFAEDGWQRLRIGSVEFRVAKPCSRCPVITVDPDTGASDPEPLATLAGFRRTKTGVMFGQNLVAETTGRIAIGQEVEILA